MAYKKIIQYGEFLELYEFEHDVSVNRKSSKERAIEQAYPYIKRNIDPHKKKRVGSSYRRPDTIKRLRKHFKRLVSANVSSENPPLMLTLTFKDYIEVNDAYKHLSRFSEKIKRKTKSRFEYIAVPEYQDRGTLHFHLLVFTGINLNYGDSYCRRVDKKTGRHFRTLLKKGAERRSHDIQMLWQAGFVHCMQTDGSQALSGYLAKYFTKSALDSRFNRKKAFVCSRAIKRERILKGETVCNLALEFTGVTNGDIVFTDIFDTNYLGKCKFTKYNFK